VPCHTSADLINRSRLWARKLFGPYVPEKTSFASALSPDAAASTPTLKRLRVPETSTNRISA